MEGASQNYFVWKDLQASPPHYGSVPEEIPPRASKRTKATFPWAHPVLPAATAPKISLKPPHKVTFFPVETPGTPLRDTCVSARGWHLWLQLCWNLLTSVGKTCYFSLSNPLHSLASSRSWTAACHLPFCCWLKIRPSSATLANSSVSDPGSEMTQKPGSLGESGQKPRSGLYLLLSDVAGATPAVPKAAESQIPCPDALGLVTLTLRLLRSAWCHMKVVVLVSVTLFSLLSWGVFPYNSLRDIKPQI